MAHAADGRTPGWWASASAATRTDARWAGTIFLVIGAQFMTAIMLAASIAPDYEYGSGAISDLGVIPETATMFNLSLVLAGVLNIVGGTLYFLSHRRTALLAAFVLAGLGAVGAGVFPLDTGTPHSLSALLAFVFFNLESIGSGLCVRGPMRWVSLALGIGGLAFVGAMVLGDSGNPALFGAIGHGGTERLIVYPPMIWLMAFGGFLIGQAGTNRDGTKRDPQHQRC